MAIAEGLTPRIGRGAPQKRRFLYDFTALGGGTGVKTLTDEYGRAAVLPDNAVITAARLESVVGLSSGGSATIKLGITGNDDCFVAATAYNNAMYAGSDKITNLTAEVPLKTSAAVSVLATIATAALITDGQFVVEIDYTEGV